MESWPTEHNNIKGAKELEKLHAEGSPLREILAAMLRSALDWEGRQGGTREARENTRRNQDGHNESDQK